MEPAKTLLIVDDDSAYGNMVTVLAQRIGWDATCTSEAEDAIGFLKERTFDCVLLDLNLRGCTGLEVLSEVPEAVRNRATIGILTNAPHKADADEAHALGVNSVLEKPYETAHVKRIFEALENA